MCHWKQWKKIGTKHRNLVRLGIPERKAWQYANARKSYWRTANSPILKRSLTNDYFKDMGLNTLSMVYDSVRIC